MGSLMRSIFAFRLKTKTSAKYGLSAQPRLVDIIAAVPPQHRKALVPKLKAKPIRTASGVSTEPFSSSIHQHPSLVSTVVGLIVFKDTDIGCPEALMNVCWLQCQLPACLFGVVPKGLMLSKRLEEGKEEWRFLVQSSVSGFLLAVETLWLSC